MTKVGAYRATYILLFSLWALLMTFNVGCHEASAQARRSEKIRISGGVLTTPKADSLKVDSLKSDSLKVDTVATTPPPSLLVNTSQNPTIAVDSTKVKKDGRFFSDSVSLSRMCWTAAVLPGYGQIYNKQAWKLPILYGTLGLGIALYSHENKTYKPLKKRYNDLISESTVRTDELDAVQSDMIRSNTKRQLYMGLTAASYIYFLGDAAINYSTNDVSSIKKATTLATICPGAGQIYNKSYWKVPFVVGGFATMIYVMDWNNRGYKRFKTAYNQKYNYDNDPDQSTNYPNGSPDEFGGRYSADYLKSIRNSYRRSRDLSIILTAGLYVLQIVDAHVDAHLKDYDISDDLSMNITPALNTTLSSSTGRECATFGFNLNLTF